jgi:chromate transporter
MMTDPRTPHAVSLREALLFWFKLGFISFGGPAGQIALMHAELVERRRWISEKRFLHALNYCMVLPGPEAQQLATYLGWLMHRTWGGVAAGVLFVLPSLFMLIGLSWVYMAWGHVPWVMGVFDGIKPAVTAIVVQAAYRIGTRTLKNAWLWAIAAAAFVAIFAANVPFPLIVLAAAGLGYVGGGAHLPAMIDDPSLGPRPTSEIPAHTRFNVWRLMAVLVSGALLWLAPMLAVMAWQGSTGTLAQMGWFFTKAALLTFGGAYAVLPYVWQGAVVEQGWLSGAQMIDGLALGETTPGPLIMVVAFVGFLGGWQSSELALWFGPEHRWLAGTVAACLVTWFTFLPSFIFILAGGPLVEATHDALHVTAPLTAITAAVVGVILNLALFFGYHVLWPQGWQGAFNAPSALIAVAAAVALLHYKRNVIHVIAACALAGWLLTVWPA